jgi:aminopeptidase
MSFDHDLEQYAEIIVKVGVNLQPGQRLIIAGTTFDPIGAPKEAAPLIHHIARHAYQAGARLVDVLWKDDELQLIRARYAPRDSFEEFPAWRPDALAENGKDGNAQIGILASNPRLYQGVDPAIVATMQKAAFRYNAPVSELVMRNAMNWLVISAATTGWAAQIFPDLAPEDATAALWDAIFDTCRVRQKDPVQAWQRHLDELTARSHYLNRKQYTALHFTAPGTDLRIGLPDGHIWRAARMTSQNGITFTPNLPTEEVFTMPHKDRVEGVVTATKPLSYGGALIENFSLTFEQGCVVAATAGRGESSLLALLDTDAGARSIGEVALVPHGSPISQSGLLFYNILFDENAADHLALGRAYRFNLDGGTTMTEAEFAAAGGNYSLTHVDFMIGSGAMDVDGLTSGGQVEPLMRGGEWAFRVE